MAMLSQSKVLAGGSRAFCGMRAAKPARVANGAHATMKRKDSYMVEVNVGEDEPEDIAVRKFMKKVMESGIIDEMRHRRYKETPLMEYKRRTKERIAARKLGIRLPTWEEEYGPDVEIHPFDEFFERDSESAASFVEGFLQYEQGPQGGFMSQGGYIDQAGWNQGGGGGYMSPGAGMGGYMNQQGGYMNQGFSAQPDYAQPAPQYVGQYAPSSTDAYGNVVYSAPAEGYAAPTAPQQGY